jgi:hypothetical protein
VPDTVSDMTQAVQPGEWRRYGFGGPPEPWDHDAKRDLDRLATSYFVDILECRRQIISANPEGEMAGIVDEMFDTASRHKHEIDYTLRHWATPVERARVEDRLGTLMRISRKLRTMAKGPRRKRPGPLPDAA